MTTIVFPGQGSQNIAMGKDFNDNFKIANLASNWCFMDIAFELLLVR